MLNDKIAKNLGERGADAEVIEMIINELKQFADE
jgi:hypothetical protein